MYYVSRVFKFDSAHYLEGYKGKCQNLHGHSWYVKVVFAGEHLDELGMLVDFGKIKSLVNEVIIEKFDHKLLNTTIPFNPTAENLAKYIYDALSIPAERYSIESVELWENYPECSVVYRP